MKDEKEYICKKTLKEGYGMTDKIINRFFSIPCKTARNPYYRRAPEMKLYSIERVKAVTQLDDFRREIEAIGAKRKSNAQLPLN